MKNVVIDGIEYTPIIPIGERKIFVLDRGFVYTGFLSHETDEKINISQARCIRMWGTNGGLAQLANDGPQTGTKLDAPMSLSAPKRAVIHIIDCKDNDKWNKS